MITPDNNHILVGNSTDIDPPTSVGQSCILVGNGSSLLERELGAAIDAYDRVVRFNLFEVKGYEKYTGERLDIWFTIRSASGAGWRANVPWSKIYARSWHTTQASCPVFTSYQGAEWLPYTMLTDMSQYTRTEYPYWSTGAMAAWKMSGIYGRVDMIGFDWWEERPRHHYNNGETLGPLHKPIIEQSFFHKLEADGRVRFI